MKLADIKTGKRYSYFAAHDAGNPPYSIPVVIKLMAFRHIIMVGYTKDYPKGKVMKIHNNDAKNIIDNLDMFGVTIPLKNLNKKEVKNNEANK